MNDSFLADLELVPAEQKAGSTVHHAERNITRRRSQPSPVNPCPEQDELNLLIAKQNTRQKVAPAFAEVKISQRRSVDSSSKEINKEIRRPVSREIKTENVKSKVPERRTKPVEKKLKPVENTNHLEVPKIDRKVDRPRWSAGSDKESSRCSDGSSKENSRPSDSSKESSAAQAESPKERARGSGDGRPVRKRGAEERFEVALLNSVKEIVSTYTKNESAKVLRAMHELYINTQSNMIKLMIQQTDDLSIEKGKDSPRLRFLVEENERLKENVAFLEARNEDLGKAVEELEQIKSENLQLKNRCNELLKSGAVREINRRSDGSSKENNRPTILSKEGASPKTRARQFMELHRNPK